ncbi:transcriptional regulator, GntR family [Lachnospiraceae bacterium KM106-2]|nr:transcriptional regulator, GntR family [Lachnospiraceae bacterium KM106-2]
MQDNLKIPINDYLPLRDVVFRTLREAILMGELKPGERLMEIKLANRLGVSRTPIREAIRKLELEGLVIMVPRKGAQVANMTQKDLHDVLEIRCALEELVIELACNRITEEEIQKLKDSLELFAAAVNRGNLTEIAEQDVAFHDIIYATSRNEKLISILNNQREQIYRYRIEYLKDYKSHNILVKEHEEIIHHLATRNIEKAKEDVKSHLYNQMMAVSKLIGEETSDQATTK